MPRTRAQLFGGAKQILCDNPKMIAIERNAYGDRMHRFYYREGRVGVRLCLDLGLETVKFITQKSRFARARSRG